ncbi:MAG: phosphate/phosphite/phosphonate ABC transporter substrate-binding protein [Myxococcaceae bacterium]
MRALWLLLLLTACPEALAPPRPMPRKTTDHVALFSPPAGFTKLRLLVPPVLARESVEKAYAKLDEYLARQLGVPVELVIGESYDDVVSRTAANDFDAVMLSPYTYALAMEKQRLPCLVQMIGDGSATAAGYIVVREDSPIRSVADLPGVRFGFVDRASTSGYIYAVKVLRDNGIDPRKHLGSMEFLGNHEAVLQAILDGRIEAGATYQGSLTAMRRSKDVDPLSFRIIAKTERTPRDILCVRADLPEVVRTELQRLLLVLTVRDRVGREILAPMSVNGFQPPDDAAYDGVRKVAAEVRAWDEQR